MRLQRESGSGLGRPGVCVAGPGDLICQGGAQVPDALDIQVEMEGAVGGQVAGRELEETDGGPGAAAILGVVGPLELLLKVDKGAGELDEPLVKGVVAVAGLEPEVLEDVVGLIVTLAVEAGKVALVARIEAARVRLVGGKAAQHAFDFFGFLHADGQTSPRKAKLQMGLETVILAGIQCASGCSPSF